MGVCVYPTNDICEFVQLSQFLRNVTFFVLQAPKITCTNEHVVKVYVANGVKMDSLEGPV